jgi:hypothetical protein
MTHDTFCIAFHKKDLPVELCRSCDAIEAARSDERARVEQQILSLIKTYPGLDKFAEGYTFALERVAAVVRAS